MTAQIKHFNTDFTKFITKRSTNRTLRHSVKIVTKTETIEVSGAVISQHSEVMMKMVQNDEEVFLNDYEFAEECVVILHGGNVVLTEDNCEEIIKFGIQFRLTDLIDQGLEYIASVLTDGRNLKNWAMDQGLEYIVSVLTDGRNLKNWVMVCYRAHRFAGSCNLEANIDYFWPLEDSVNSLSTPAIKELVADINLTEGAKVILEMMKNGILAKKVLRVFTSLIDRSNIDEIVSSFVQVESYDLYTEAFWHCKKYSISYFFSVIEHYIPQKMPNKQLKIYQDLKKSILREMETKNLQFELLHSDLLASRKHYNVEKVEQVFKVFGTDFYVVEVLMSWVTLNKPDLKTVRHLCSLIDIQRLSFKMDVRGILKNKYLEHVTQVFKAEGYTVSLNSLRSGDCRLGSINAGGYPYVHKLTFIFDDTYNVMERRLDFEFIYDIPNNIHLAIILNKDGLKADPEAPNNSWRIYGRTVEGKQIPFYTDIQAALKAETVYDLKTLMICV